MSKTMKLRVWYRGKMFCHVEHTTYADGPSGVTLLQSDDCYDGRSFSPDSDHKVEIMQFIGMPDRHGKEACQGDILKGEDGYIALVEAGFSTSDVSLCLLKEVGNDLPALTTKVDHLEVIGNVYEHSELLAKEQ